MCTHTYRSPRGGQGTGVHAGDFEGCAHVLLNPGFLYVVLGFFALDWATRVPDSSRHRRPLWDLCRAWAPP